jgi:hypothetical protein
MKMQEINFKSNIGSLFCRARYSIQDRHYGQVPTTGFIMHDINKLVKIAAREASLNTNVQETSNV